MARLQLTVGNMLRIDLCQLGTLIIRISLSLFTQYIPVYPAGSPPSGSTIVRVDYLVGEGGILDSKCRRIYPACARHRFPFCEGSPPAVRTAHASLPTVEGAQNKPEGSHRRFISSSRG